MLIEVFQKHLIEIRVKAQSRHQVLTVRSRSLPGLITIKKFCDADGGSGDDDGNGGSDGGDGGDGGDGSGVTDGSGDDDGDVDIAMGCKYSNGLLSPQGRERTWD